LYPDLSVIVPAYNEEAGIAATVRSLLDTDYPGAFEVIVVDDGSSDRTAAIVEGLALPGVRLLRKPNGGKPSALNAGAAMARGEILVLVDGDTVFQRDTLRHLVGPLADPRVGAVSGNTKVANRGGLLGRWQHIEYVIGFNLDRRMFDVLQCMPTVPGAIGAFRRSVLARVGGVPADTLAEDTDLTMAICRSGYRVVYEEKAIAWTEAPSSLRQLWRQRYRWCYGTMQAMWKHRRSLVERGASGRFGRRCLTYLAVFQVVLPLFAPAVDLFALFGLVFLNPVGPILLWAGFVAAQTAAGAYALWLDGERVRPLWALPLQQFVYRQLMYLVVVQSVVTALLGSRLGWHTIRRTGTFSDVPPQPASAR
jgi:cellulose synthase/poly-beta-1,6-N-acetylglucosamine synthase-like glycosyltransferase